MHERYQLAVAAPGIKWVSTTPCRWWCSPAVRELICLQESAGIHKKQRHFLFATAYVCIYIFIYILSGIYIYPWVVRFPERNIHMVSAMHGDNVHWTWTHGRCHSTGTPGTDASMGVSTTNVFLVDDYRFKKNSLQGWHPSLSYCKVQMYCGCERFWSHAQKYLEKHKLSNMMDVLRLAKNGHFQPLASELLLPLVFFRKQSECLHLGKCKFLLPGMI